MEITPVSYIEIKLINNEDENEVKQFYELVKHVYKESARPGLTNPFADDRPIIKKLMEGLSIKVENERFGTTAGDTHTHQVFNE